MGGGRGHEETQVSGIAARVVTAGAGGARLASITLDLAPSTGIASAQGIRRTSFARLVTLVSRSLDSRSLRHLRCFVVDESVAVCG